MATLPAHASPLLSPRPQNGNAARKIPEFDLTVASHRIPPPPSLISPAFTPPSTPSSGLATPNTRHHLHKPKSVSVDTSDTSSKDDGPQLLPKLPKVTCVVRARIPTVTGAEMFLHLYQNDADDKEHLAIVFGSNIRSTSLDSPRPGETEMDRMIRGAYVGRLHPGRTSSRWDSTPALRPEGQEVKRGAPQASLEASKEQEDPLVRIHSECYTGETAWSARCDCGEQLDEAARLMSLPDSTGGVIVYLRQEGRGIGLGEKLKAYNLQDLGNDTVEANLLLRHPADARSYGLATAILMDLGLGRGDEVGEGQGGLEGAGLEQKGIRLLTNNPDKVRAVEGPNREVKVTQRVAMVPLAWKTGGKRGIHSSEIDEYLRTKIGKMGHMIE